MLAILKSWTQSQALTRFFPKRDSTKANNLRCLVEDSFGCRFRHGRCYNKAFRFKQDYSDAGYDLPPLDIRWHEIPVHYGDAADKDRQMQLISRGSRG